MTKSKKTRPKKRSTNMSGGLLNELQALIAFACYDDSPSLFRRGMSLSEAAIKNAMSSIFCGDDKNGADPDLITYIDHFTLGLNKFKGLFTQSLQAGPNASGEVLLSIPDYLHCDKKLLVYVDDGSIEKGTLSQKSVNGDYGAEDHSRTLLQLLRQFYVPVKMMVIVRAKGTPYKDGAFPSGTNWEDYILWCSIKMGKKCDREEAARIDAAHQKEAAAEVARINAVQEEKATANNALEEEKEGGGPELVSNSTSELLTTDNYTDATFFKCGVGFLAC